MSEQLRVIIDPPQHGSWNMAVDQSILQSTSKNGSATLRLYRWAPATISLGYFQPHNQRLAHAPSRNCPVVRRASGGGAIVHDRELTYSLSLPSGDRWSSQNRRILELVHQSLIDVLAEIGVGTCRLFSGGANKALAPEPFLCFERRADGDVLLGPDKIIGSAQRRVRGALLQHGSLLIGRSEFAPELPGMVDLSNVEFDDRAFIARWTNLVSELLGKSAFESVLEPDEYRFAEKHEESCFASQKWTKRR